MPITGIKVQLTIQQTEGDRVVELTSIDSDDVATILLMAERNPEVGVGKVKRITDFFEGTIEEKLMTCAMVQAQQGVRERRTQRRKDEGK